MLLGCLRSQLKFGEKSEGRRKLRKKNLKVAHAKTETKKETARHLFFGEDAERRQYFQCDILTVCALKYTAY